MSNRKRVVFPLVAAVVVVLIALAAWGMPQVRAAVLGPSTAGPGVTLQEQPQDQKPWIGVSLVNNGPSVKDKLGLTTDQGVVIARVVSDSPGAKAGLAQKDIIIAVDGAAVKTARDVTNAISAKKVGGQVTLTILRGSQEMKITVTLGAAPEQPKAQPGLALRTQPGLALRGWPGGILGTNPGENLRSATIELTDKDGNKRTLEMVAGTVQSASATSLSVVPNGDTTARTFQVTQDTRVGPGAKVENLKQGDKVFVLAEGGKALQVIGGSAAPQGTQGPRSLPFPRFGPHTGGQQQQQPPTGGTL